MEATMTRFDPVRVRIERAEKALAEGRFTIRRMEPEGSTYRWSLENGGGRKYTITYDRRSKSFGCTCPDFQNRGEEVGTCKHIEAVKMWERQRRRADGKADTEAAPTPTKETNDGFEAFIAVMREQNRLLQEQNEILRKYLQQIDIALAQGLGLV